MKKKQQYEMSAKIAMISLIVMVGSLTAIIGLGKSSEAAEAIPPATHTWTPTAEDQARMDSLYAIDAATKADIDSIRCMIQDILLKLE
jgi:hypothetical protein